MRRKLEIASLGNVLRLFSGRLKEFTGESRRSYQKAYSSFQIYLVGNYSMNVVLENSVIENWVVSNILQGLTRKTISFYLDKISSLYSAIGHKLIGGKGNLFKEVKKKFKDLHWDIDYSKVIKKITSKVRFFNNRCLHQNKDCLIIEKITSFPEVSPLKEKSSIKYIWGCIALYSGVHPDIVKGIIGKGADILKLLDFCTDREVSLIERKQASKSVEESLKGEELQWFAMRLRPRAKFERLIERFSEISDEIKLPELFYPSEEIVKRVGHKVVWKGKPIIHDVVFFKSHKSDIYPLFTKIYDIAWCYRTPGGGTGSYAAIPGKAMENFKKSIGLLSADFELAPAGEMGLKPGDKVVIIDGDYTNELAEVLKKPYENEHGNKIYRVTLLNSNGHWDIGIDARLLKKA